MLAPLKEFRIKTMKKRRPIRHAIAYYQNPPNLPSTLVCRPIFEPCIYNTLVLSGVYNPRKKLSGRNRVFGRNNNVLKMSASDRIQWKIMIRLDKTMRAGYYTY